MNGLLWVMQILLALHTAMGAVWKISNPAEAVGSLTAIPDPIWKAIIGLEFVFAFLLVAPLFSRPLARYAPLGALGVLAVMIGYCAVHVNSGETDNGPLIYWGVVAAVSGFVAYGRWKLAPHR